MIENNLISETFYDWRWRLNNLYQIQDKNGQKVLFRENKLQKIINDDPYPFKQILKSRQIGFTTNFMLRMLDYVIWGRNKNAFCMAHDQDSIKKIFRTVIRAYKYLKDEHKPLLADGGGSMYEYYFPEMESRIAVGLHARGDTIHWLHISEAAFTDPDRIRATIEAVPPNGIITFETTANGIGNHFYDRWMAKNRFKNYFFPWFLFDDYQIPCPKLQRTKEEIDLTNYALKEYSVKLTDAQINFRRIKSEDQGDKRAQEYPDNDVECFLMSGQPAMKNKLISKLLADAPKPVSIQGNITIYKPCVRGRPYVCGADPAEGVGGDFSSASMFDAITREQVATLRGQIEPEVFANELLKFCGLYSTPGKLPPLLAVERNNHGHAVLLWLNSTHHYQNLFWTRKNDGTRDKLGWLSDKVTRPLMIDALKEAVHNGSVDILDTETLRECLTLVNNDGKIEAAPGKHDDCFIAAAIAVQMILKGDSSLYENFQEKIRI